MVQEQNASFCSLFPQQAFGQCRHTGALKERSRGDSRPRLSGRARLDLLYGQGKTSVARCLNRIAEGGRPHVVSCRDTPHHEHTNEKVTHSRKPPAGGARNSGASLRRPAGAALPAVLPAYIFPAAPQSQEAIVPDMTFLGCMAISSCHLSPPCRAT